MKLSILWTKEYIDPCEGICYSHGIYAVGLEFVPVLWVNIDNFDRWPSYLKIRHYYVTILAVFKKHYASHPQIIIFLLALLRSPRVSALTRWLLFSKCNFASGNMYLLSFNNMIFLRSEIAWKNANYAQILEYLREEYELNQRFGSLDFKLKFVEVSALCTNSSILQKLFLFSFRVCICSYNLLL